MEDILREFRSAIRVPCNGTCEWREITGPKITLTDRLAESGFVLSSAYCFGVTLSANIAWSFQDDYSGWQNITAGFLEFRPRCGKLNDGKWIGQRWHENIENHFFERFATIAPRTPKDCFRGPEDIENLLTHFEWATTTRHSEPELRQMRIEAIQKAPELWAKPKELAELLKRKDLYSRSTSSSQIVKFLPALIEKAGNLKIKQQR